jgi:uncharacterized protein (TIGR02145 family)
MATRDIDTVNIAIVPVPPLKGYGLLYNSYAYAHADFAPANWKVPTFSEWSTLLTTVAENKTIISNKVYPTYISGWQIGAGNNITNFSIVPNGARFSTGLYYSAQLKAYLASSTPYSSLGYRYILVEDLSIYTYLNCTHNTGIGVRLLMIDTSGWSVGETVTDRDGNTYDTVKIGNQVWIDSNWKSTKLEKTNVAIPNVTGNAIWNAAVTPAYCSYNNLPLIEE